ncbi:MAG: DUF1173 family protein, partial [Hyphomicrobiales bacterium]|nr:DUF1173 family protein [Hyphomicrobiales bacterium]
HYKGRRFWGVVSNRLNAALCGKTSKTFSYDHIAYIPAQFDPAHPAANGRTRLAKTLRAIGDRHRMIFIGEFKELTQGKFGPVLKLKHVDCAITVADELKRRMQSRFKAEFAACGANSRIHLIACCLVDFNKAGYPSLAEIGFLTVSPEWLPFSSEAEAMLIQSLMEGSRSFSKTLRYDLPDEATIAAVILKDVGAEGVALFLDDGSRADALRQALEDCPMPTWVWNILEPMPPLPKARVQTKQPEPVRSQTNPLRSFSPRSAQASSAWRR